MTSKEYATPSGVEQTPEQVFAAVNNVRGWWSGEIDGPTDRLGGEFTYRQGTFIASSEHHRAGGGQEDRVARPRLRKSTSSRTRRQWNGTDVVFDIARKGNKTELRFTHLGLEPSIECYGKCLGRPMPSTSMRAFKSLITTGKGDPNATKS